MAHIRKQEPPPGQPPNPYDQFFIGEMGFVAGQADAFLSLLSYAVEEGYRADNPAHRIVKPAYQKRTTRLDMVGYKRLGELLRIAEERGVLAGD